MTLRQVFISQQSETGSAETKIRKSVKYVVAIDNVAFQTPHDNSLYRLTALCIIMIIKQ